MVMQVEMCLGKIHRATVTGADLDYVGSITIDQLLIKAAGLLPGQVVHVNNVRNGYPWETYIVPGEAGKGEIILNGPPAHHFTKGDIVIIWGGVMVNFIVARKMTNPTVVFVDGKNRITEVKEGWHPS
ncbi:MAG: aspartate 1-decarboxylase [Minisyncoccia bacterium]